MTRSIHHRPVVRARTTKDGRTYRFECTCSARCEWVPERAAAVHAREQHVWTIAPDADDRCRDTKAHRTRWWDDCPLCKFQEFLPGFEDLGATG